MPDPNTPAEPMPGAVLLRCARHQEPLSASLAGGTVCLHPVREERCHDGHPQVPAGGALVMDEAGRVWAGQVPASWEPWDRGRISVAPDQLGPAGDAA